MHKVRFAKVMTQSVREDQTPLVSVSFRSVVQQIRQKPKQIESLQVMHSILTLRGVVQLAVLLVINK